MKRRKEYGPSDFHKMLSGLRQAAQQIYREEFNKIVAPAPVQLRFPFIDDKRPELPKAKSSVPFESSAGPITSDGLDLTDRDRDFLRNLKIEIPDNARWPIDEDSADPEAAL